MKKNTWALACLSLFLLSACASSGQKIEQTKVDTIRLGVTTRAQLEAQFGSPTQVDIEPGTGHRVLTYRYTEARANAASYVPVVSLFAGGVNSKEQTLTVIVDKKTNIVRDYEMHNANNSTMNGSPN